MAQQASCKECGWRCKNCSDQATLHLHVEIENLKQRLLEREHHIVTMETNFLTEAEKFPNGEFAALTEELLTWQEKYSRLYESHKRVQKVNQSLEDKLLKIVDKCETEKNSLTRDITGLTQKLVDARSKIHRLQEENERYRNDVNLAIQLLQCKPANFVSHKFDMLPADLQQKVRTYVSSKRKPSDGNGNTQNKPEPKTIKVPIPTFPPTAMVYSISKAPADKEEDSDEKSAGSKPPVDIVSAAIMAKVLEERERERLHTKHCDSCTCPRQCCVDQSTQTSWDHSLVCIRCASNVKCENASCSSSAAVDTSTRASQGLVRYVDAVATRNGEMRSVRKNENSQYLSLTDSGAKELRQDRCIKQNCDSDADTLCDMNNRVITKKSDSLGSRNGRSANKNVEIYNKHNGTNSNTLKTKEGLFVKASKIPNKNVDTSRSSDSRLDSEHSVTNSELNQTPDASKDSCSAPDHTCKNTKELTSHLNRLTKFHVKTSGESSAMRLKSREGRTYLSDVANIDSKVSADSIWTRHTNDVPKPIDKKDLSTMLVQGKGNGNSTKVAATTDTNKVSTTTKPKETGRNGDSTHGPRHCSLRVQAGTSNILLDNATSYAPVLYTSRHGNSSITNGADITSTVLVHTARSRSASASSTDETHYKTEVHSKAKAPAETEL